MPIVAEPITIVVSKVNVDTDPSTHVFQVEIFDKNGTWHETFNTEELVRAFLRGMRVATTMVLLTYNMEQHWKFDPESAIDQMP